MAPSCFANFVEADGIARTVLMILLMTTIGCFSYTWGYYEGIHNAHNGPLVERKSSQLHQLKTLISKNATDGRKMFLPIQDIPDDMDDADEAGIPKDVVSTQGRTTVSEKRSDRSTQSLLSSTQATWFGAKTVSEESTKFKYSALRRDAKRTDHGEN